MRNFLIAGSRFIVSGSLVLLLCVSAFSQVSLREGLDADGDNKADYTIFRPSDSNWWTFRSGGGFSVQQFGIASEDIPVPADYDGDGKMDIAVWRDTTGTWYRILSMTNTYTVQGWGQTGDEPVARDFDGDGKADMGIVRRSNGVMTWYFLYATGGFTSVQYGLQTDYIAPGDYDGDGKFDLAVQRPGADATAPSTFFILNSEGFRQVQYGLTNDLVVPGDYDGDGKTDLAVVRESSNPATLSWWILRSDGGGLVGPVVWGNSLTDLTVQGDYNGDGKTELAVWRNCEINGQPVPGSNDPACVSKFYTFDLNGAFNVKAWGQPGDYPIASHDTH